MGGAIVRIRDHFSNRSPYVLETTPTRERRGGYPKDHVWSESYRSKQAGLAAILKNAESGKVRRRFPITYYYA